MAAPGAPAGQGSQQPRRQRALSSGACVARLLLPNLVVLLLCLRASGAAPPAPAVATNWATPAMGATATANSAGHWAGYTAEPRFALDGDPASYWSSAGGTACCTESNPAWLLVSLGTMRPIAALQVAYSQDLSFTLALANASTGPFVTVAAQFCELCVPMVHLDPHRSYAVAGAPVVASFVRMQITYSSYGGVGGCDDLCDWATDVRSFAVFGPGALPEAAQAAAPPPPVGRACADETQLISPQAGGDVSMAALTGGASLQPAGSGAHGSTAIRLTEAEPLQRGAAEFTRVIRPAEECGCSDEHGLEFSLHVWMGGSRELPGEGLVISLVDASKQTPGATRFVQAGCGVRLAVPLHAQSIVFDTADNDVSSCENQQHGTGMRFVSTLDPNAPPVVLQSTLEMSTSAYRAARWVQLFFTVRPFWAPAVTLIHVDGVELLADQVPIDRAGFGVLDAFYVVASASTSERAVDAHLISRLEVTCRLSAQHFRPEHWAGYRQPFTPPPMFPPPPPAETQQLAPALSDAPRAAVSFVAAFGISTALLTAVGIAARLRRRRRDVLVVAEDEKTVRLSFEDAVKSAQLALVIDAAAEAQGHGFDVFLSYRRLDYRLADAVHDKLRLCGLRVFKDIEGRMAGTPFGTEMVRAVRGAPIFAPVVTLPSLQRMAAAASPDAEVDFTLAEWLVALHFRAAGRVRLIHPLLAGQPQPHAEASQKSHLVTLAVEDAQYALALAALPDGVPVATTRAVSAALRAACDAPLSPEEAAMSVRDIVCGAAGVLSGTVFAVDCLPGDLGLYIRSRYAPPMLRVVAETARTHTC